ncbi:MAG: hypothetical protein ACPGVO_02390 [Spirulinaceae cyanobacterium]
MRSAQSRYDRLIPLSSMMTGKITTQRSQQISDGWMSDRRINAS